MQFVLFSIANFRVSFSVTSSESAFRINLISSFKSLELFLLPHQIALKKQLATTQIEMVDNLVLVLLNSATVVVVPSK